MTTSTILKLNLVISISIYSTDYTYKLLVYTLQYSLITDSLTQLVSELATYDYSLHSLLLLVTTKFKTSY